MKKAITTVAATLLLTLGTQPMLGATTFTTSGGTITSAGNWDNGLPIGQQGTININADWDVASDHANFNILHTGGTLAPSGFTTTGMALGTDATWVMSGATAAIASTRGLRLSDGATFQLIQGDANLTANNVDTTVSDTGTSIVVDGGTMSIGRDLIVRNDASFTVNGGTVTIGDQIFTQSFATSAAGFFFNGGSTTADNFQLDKAATATFGGSTAGSLNLLTGLGNGVTLDWQSGSLMELTVAGADQAFYEGLYGSGVLVFEGSNAGAFGDNFEVDGATLSLVIPEPSSLALLGLGGLFMARRRRDY